MNALEFLAHFLNVILACSALPISEQVIGGQNLQVQSWVCQTANGPVVAKVWKRECNTGHTRYWGRNFYLLFDEWQQAEYLDRFGGVSFGEGAQLIDAYLPPCGS